VELLEPALPWTVALDSLPAQSFPYHPLADLRIRYRAPAEVAAVQFGTAAPVVAFVDGRAAPDVTCGISVVTGMSPVTGAGEAVLPIHGSGCVRDGGEGRTAVRPDSIRARLLVTAYDAPSFRYQTAMPRYQMELGAAAEGVSGAMGLFAGVATTEHLLTLVPAE
jgi:hypothetical protein